MYEPSGALHPHSDFLTHLLPLSNHPFLHSQPSTLGLRHVRCLLRSVHVFGHPDILGLYLDPLGHSIAKNEGGRRKNKTLI